MKDGLGEGECKRKQRTVNSCRESNEAKYLVDDDGSRSRWGRETEDDETGGNGPGMWSSGCKSTLFCAYTSIM